MSRHEHNNSYFSVPSNYEGGEESDTWGLIYILTLLDDTSNYSQGDPILFFTP